MRSMHPSIDMARQTSKVYWRRWYILQGWKLFFSPRHYVPVVSQKKKDEAAHLGITRRSFCRRSTISHSVYSSRKFRNCVHTCDGDGRDTPGFVWESAWRFLLPNHPPSAAIGMLRLSDMQKMRMLNGEELLLNLATLVVASFEGKLCTVR